MNDKTEHARLLTVLLVLLAAVQQLFAQPYDLTCEQMDNPLGINTVVPRFSWKNTGMARQTAYQLQVAADSALLARGKTDRWDSGRVSSDEQVMVAYGGAPLSARDYCYWRVRAFDENGQPTAWSAIRHFSIGLDETAIKGSYIMLPASAGCQEAPIFRKQITLRRRQQTLIHVNSLGYHELYVNGQRIGDRVLEPAMTQLDRRSAIVAYDITSAVRKGKNDIVIALGQGWYKPVYFHSEHPGPLVKAEIDVRNGSGWQVVASTDASWLAVASGYSGIGTWEPLQFGGERLDGRRQPKDMTAASLDTLAWTQAETVSISVGKATPEMFAGNRIAKIYRPKTITRQSDGTWLVDMGVCLSGWFAIRFHNLREGQTVVMRYSDNIVDGKPNDYNEYDEYTARGEDGERFCNRFHSHAYQYVTISGLEEKPEVEDIEGLLITATSEPRTSFRCSDNDINAIHDMIQYTMRCLTYSGYMVDCAHLERMGYGGDGNSSTRSLQTMFDVAPTYYNWLQAWDDVQDDNGSLPYVAPAGIRCGGGPYWCAFIVMAAWRTYQAYGDARPLEEHYEAMKKWLGYVREYSPEGLLRAWHDTHNRYWYLGDWLAPDGIDVRNERSVDFVNNACISVCLGNMADMARLLGKQDDAQRFADWQQSLRQWLVDDFWHPADSTFASASPLDMAMAVESGIATGSMAEAVSEKLIKLSRGKYNSHIAVGLVGVPVFTEWATRQRQTELMYDILKQPDYPGYLNMIRQGATTTWESWDHSRSSIHNCYNGIGTWFYEALGGIVATEPAYRRVSISPQYARHIDWVDVRKECPYGTIVVKWQRNAGGITLDVTLPVGVTADVAGKTVGAGRHEFLMNQ